MSLTRFDVGVARPAARQRRPDRRHVVQLHVRQDQVLLVGDPDVVLADSARRGRPRPPSARRWRRRASRRWPSARSRRWRSRRPCAACTLLRAKRAKAGSAALAASKASDTRRQGLEAWRREGAADAGELGVRQVDRGPSIFSHSASTWRANSSRAQRGDQDLDPRLVDVVAPAVAIVDPQDRLQVREQPRRPAGTRGSSGRCRACGPGRRRPSPRSPARRRGRAAGAGRCRGSWPPCGPWPRR